MGLAALGVWSIMEGRCGKDVGRALQAVVGTEWLSLWLQEQEAACSHLGSSGRERRIPALSWCFLLLPLSSPGPFCSIYPLCTSPQSTPETCLLDDYKSRLVHHKDEEGGSGQGAAEWEEFAPTLPPHNQAGATERPGSWGAGGGGTAAR